MIRNDLSIDWSVSPRIVWVAAPSTEITMQDLLDTLRYLEAQGVAMDDPSIVSASGKEPLGGGVYVGLTVTLQDAQVAFEARPGPAYVQCSLGGGNLVSFDALDAPLSPVYPTAFTQIVKTSSASATLQELADVQYASFNGGVSISVANGYPGTGTAPNGAAIGTQRAPSNNVNDAMAIAQLRGFSTLYVDGPLTLGAGNDVSYMRIMGSNPLRAFLDILPAANTLGVEINGCTTTGVLDGGAILREGYVFDLDYISGFVFQCELAGKISIANGSTAHIMQCFAEVNRTYIDFGGAGQSLNMQAFSGDLVLQNKTGPEQCGIHLISGTVTVENTVTDTSGIHISGVAHVDNQTGLTIPLDRSLSVSTVSNAVWQSMVEAGYSAAQILRLLASVATGDATGLESGSPQFLDLAGVKPRVQATYAGGVRTVTTRDAS